MRWLRAWCWSATLALLLVGACRIDPQTNPPAAIELRATRGTAELGAKPNYVVTGLPEGHGYQAGRLLALYTDIEGVVDPQPVGLAYVVEAYAHSFELVPWLLDEGQSEAAEFGVGEVPPGEHFGKLLGEVLEDPDEPRRVRINMGAMHGVEVGDTYEVLGEPIGDVDLGGRALGRPGVGLLQVVKVEQGHSSAVIVTGMAPRHAHVVRDGFKTLDAPFKLEILLVEFEGELGEAYSESLRRALEQEISLYPNQDIRIQRTDQQVESAERATAIGREWGADIVLWGTASQVGETMAVWPELTFVNPRMHEELGWQDAVKLETERAFKRDPDVVSRRVQGLASYLVGLMYYEEYDYEKAAAHFTLLLSIDDHAEPDDVDRARVLSYYCNERIGNWAEAEQAARTIEREGAERKDGWRRALGLLMLADAATRRGAHAEALDHAKHAYRLFVERDDVRGRALTMVQVADIMGEMGVAQVEVDGQQKSGLDLYRESLDLRRTIVREFGRSPSALRDVSISLERVADIMGEMGVAQVEVDGQQKSGLDLYRESLDLRRTIVREFGRSPSALRDVSISLERVADIMGEMGVAQVEVDGQQKSGLDLYRESLDLRRTIVREFGRSPSALRDVSISLERVADIMGEMGVAQVEVDGQQKSGLDLYRESLDLSRTIVREFGRSPEALRDVSVSLERVADIMGEMGVAQVEVDGQQKSGLDLYRESLDLRRTIVREFGRSPSALRDVSISLERVADIMGEMGVAQVEVDGQQKSGLDLYRESLDLSRTIVREFGRSPEALRDVSVSLNKVADIMGEMGVAQVEVDGQQKSGLDLYRESLDLRRTIVREFGRSPSALRDVSVSLIKVADSMGEIGVAQVEVDGQQKSGLDLYRESLDLSRTIVREFGRSPEALRDVSISLDRVADIMGAMGVAQVEVDGQQKSGLDLYRESLDLRRTIVREFGRSPSALRDVSISLNKVADIMGAMGVAQIEVDGQQESGLDLYRESLDIFRTIVREFGRSPSALRDVSISLNKVADIMGAMGVAQVEVDGQQKSGLDLYRESLDLRRTIVREFGRSPSALRDVSISLDRVADIMGAMGVAQVEVDGQQKSGLDLYRESLDLSRTIVREFGRSPSALRDVSISLERVADIMGEMGVAQVEVDGQQKSGLDLYRESLNLRRTIVREFGRSPSALRDVSVSLNKVADIMGEMGVAQVEVDGQQKSGLDLYRESLDLSRTIVREFGRSPEALRDVSVSLNKVADIMGEMGVAQVEVDGQQKSGLDLYRESLDLRRTIVREFGRSPSALRDLMTSHSRFATLAIDAGDVNEACAQLQSCHELVLEIETRGWSTALTKDDRSWVDSVKEKLSCDGW